MKAKLTAGERAYLLWVDSGHPGYARKLPQRLVALGLVEDLEGEPHLTWEGAHYATHHRANDDHGGNAY